MPRRNDELSKEEWTAWLDQPVTRVFRELLRRRREALKEQWCSGGFTHPDLHAAAIKNASAIGACEAIQDLLDLEVDVVNGEMSDEQPEQVGAASPGPSGPGGAV